MEVGIKGRVEGQSRSKILAVVQDSLKDMEIPFAPGKFVVNDHVENVEEVVAIREEIREIFAVRQKLKRWVAFAVEMNRPV